ncbi:MAG: putative rane-anchored protein [Mycobacterium sp.]|nr:putative rane-anchored protein [Mycobacterium sp.]
MPGITASFWVLKLLTTAMGEAASDYLLGTMGFVGLGLGAAGFAFALWVQFRTRRFNVFAYWAAVMMVAVFGTMAADTVHHELGVPYEISSLVFAVAVAATFWASYRVEHTLSIHSITTRRREVFYWLTVSFTFALGTALGDLSASTLHFGFVGSIVLFTVVMAVPALGYCRFRLNSVIAFWWAYIVTRPLGASVADWLSKPTQSGGRGFGDGPVAAVLLELALVLITVAAVRRRNTAGAWAGSQLQPLR